jgi:uncharacterized protein (TIGR03083 family)
VYKSPEGAGSSERDLAVADAGVPAMVDAELEAFSTLARALTPEQWKTPSLCAGWTVRDVVEHTAFHTHRGLKETLGSTEKHAPRLAAAAHAETIDGLVAWISSPAPANVRKSKINLAELVIHQQDVRRPLGIARDYPDAAIRTSLELCTSVNGNILALEGRRRPGRGLRLHAPDLDWSKGRGPEVVGSAEALLMAIAGRRIALHELSGPGVATLAARLDTASAPVHA